jgi:hypothetical protein
MITFFGRLSCQPGLFVMNFFFNQAGTQILWKTTRIGGVCGSAKEEKKVR